MFSGSNHITLWYNNFSKNTFKIQTLLEEIMKIFPNTFSIKRKEGR